jgi:hypothetical protein
MNVRLQRDFTIPVGLVYQNHYSINLYQVKIDFMTTSIDAREQNIAYQRVKHWIYGVMSSGVLISQDSEMLKSLNQTGLRIIVLPEEPVDQLVGMALMAKLNAIMQDRIVVTDIEISSAEGDHMKYLHSIDDNAGPFAEDGWWTDPRPNWSTNKKASSKIVALDRSIDWKDLDLDWADTDRPDNHVVFADFSHNDKK